MDLGDKETERELAWIGDAVLALYAREWAAARVSGPTRIECFTLMTSNRFLAGNGPPTRVEAGIGLVYREKGLAAAFAHIEETLVPRFRKHWERQRARGTA